MDGIEYADDEVVSIPELVGLYESVGWLAYTADPDGLARAVDRSTTVVTARDEDQNLVGLARCLSDDVSIMWLQDVLVHPDHRRKGIATFLVSVCLHKYSHVRQKVLMTDDEPGQAAFYRSLGYKNTTDFGAPTINVFAQIANHPDQQTPEAAEG